MIHMKTVHLNPGANGKKDKPYSYCLSSDRDVYKRQHLPQGEARRYGEVQRGKSPRARHHDTLAPDCPCLLYTSTSFKRPSIFSEVLEELLDAGATSLKIEGRLKDVTYVKNVTAVKL